MRYLLAWLAALAAISTTRVLADPFDDLSERLDRYEQQTAPRQVRTASGTAPAPTPEAVPADAPIHGDGHMHGDGPILDGGGNWEGDWGGGDYGGPYMDGGSCGGPCLGGCDQCCGCCAGWYGRAEYLAWWVRGANTPPLVTTSPNGTPASTAGQLPGATVLFGGDRINESGRSGGRFTLGYMFPCCSTMGIEDTFFFLGNQGDSYHASSSGSPILARPFFNTDSNSNDSVLIAYPNIVVGNIAVTSNSRVYGNEVNLRRSLYMDCWRRVDLLAGYRFFQINEELGVNTNTTSVDPSGPVVVGTQFNLFDSFATRSQFNGGQLGVNLRHTYCRWSFDFLAKVALGGLTQTVTINGGTMVTVPNQTPVTQRGGILAQDSNIGQFNRTQFAVMPEIGLNMHYNLSQCWTVNFGYTLLVVTNVVRPGDQIDTGLDPNQFPPPNGTGPFTRPAFAFHDSDLWLQGLNVGLEFNF